MIFILDNCEIAPLFKKSAANNNLSNARRMLNGLADDTLLRPCAKPTGEHNNKRVQLEEFIDK